MMLERLFSSKTRVEILRLLFLNPDGRYYVRQIARELSRDISGIKRELDNLDKAGLLTSEKLGEVVGKRYVQKYFPPEAKVKAQAMVDAVVKAFGREQHEARRFYDLAHRRRLSVKPGLTCLWQISGRSQIDFHEWMKLDLLYIDSWSLKLDFKILLQTVPAVMMAKGAH